MNVVPAIAIVALVVLGIVAWIAILASTALRFYVRRSFELKIQKEKEREQSTGSSGSQGDDDELSGQDSRE